MTEPDISCGGTGFVSYWEGGSLLGEFCPGCNACEGGSMSAGDDLVTDRDKVELALQTEDGAVTPGRLQEITGVSTDGIRKVLQELKNEGKVVSGRAPIRRYVWVDAAQEADVTDLDTYLFDDATDDMVGDEPAPGDGDMDDSETDERIFRRD